MVVMKIRDARRMRGSRPAVFLAVAAVLLSVILTAGCGGEDATVTTGDPGGRLQIAETSHDFGSVPVGQKVEHDFLLNNSGPGPLNLGQMEIKRLEGC
ncbi:MAG: hypothetical protein ACYC6B_05075 [Thermoleophilia bacterium]